MRRKKLNIEAIKQIPILDVAQSLHIPLKKTGIGVWCARDPEDANGVSSLTIFENKNWWMRYSEKTQGGCYKGSVIDLVMHWRDNADFREAVEYLSSSFPTYR